MMVVLKLSEAKDPPKDRLDQEKNTMMSRVWCKRLQKGHGLHWHSIVLLACLDCHLLGPSHDENPGKTS